MSMNWQPISEFDDFSGDCTRYLVCDHHGFTMYGELMFYEHKPYFCAGSEWLPFDEATHFVKIELPDELV